MRCIYFFLLHNTLSSFKSSFYLISAPLFVGDTLHAPNTIAKATPRLCLHAENLEMEAISSSGSNGNVSLERVKLLATSIPPY